MKAMMLTGLSKMAMRETPMPEIKTGTDVLLKMVVVGVCGSDVHYYSEGNIGTQVVQYPFIVGHECSAVVEKVGKKVARVRPGDRVAIEPAMSCGTCDQCRAGRPNTCRRLRFLGCPGQGDGCLAEYLVMPQECCYPIGSDITMEQAALSEPLSISVYSVKQSLPLEGMKIAILGCGPIGLTVLLCARLKRPATIYATDKIPERLQAAKRAGADWVGNPDKIDVVKAVDKAEPLQLDVVFECCGQQDAIDQAVDLLKPGGKLILVGIPKVERISFIIDRIRRKELSIINIRRQCECVQPALDLIGRREIEVDFMVTHRYPFEKTQEAFELVSGYNDGVIKAMVHFD